MITLDCAVHLRSFPISLYDMNTIESSFLRLPDFCVDAKQSFCVPAELIPPNPIRLFQKVCLQEHQNRKIFGKFSLKKGAKTGAFLVSKKLQEGREGY
jgi:hypothetical protein